MKDRQNGIPYVNELLSLIHGGSYGILFVLFHIYRNGNMKREQSNHQLSRIVLVHALKDVESSTGSQIHTMKTHPISV
jgi:hypothetical protein